MRRLYPALRRTTNEQTNNKQLPDYRASPDFFVAPIGLFEIWRSANISLSLFTPVMFQSWHAPVMASVATAKQQTTNNEQTTNKQLPDYSAYPDFFVGPIGLFEIWRSAINNKAVFRAAPGFARVC